MNAPAELETLQTELYVAITRYGLHPDPATAESAPAGNRTCEDRFVSVGDAQTCVERARSIDRALVLGATAAPLLTLPLTYLLRRNEKKREATVTPSVAFGPSGGSLSFSGRF